jgi:hypothetical protein
MACNAMVTRRDLPADPANCHPEVHTAWIGCSTSPAYGVSRLDAAHFARRLMFHLPYRPTAVAPPCGRFMQGGARQTDGRAPHRRIHRRPED